MAKAKKYSAVALAVAAVAAGAWFTVPYETTAIHATYAVSLDTPRLAAGWADDIFVASIDSQDSAERDSDDFLCTPFEVTVKATLQGSVSGHVRVVQEGGDDPISRERVVFDGATPLEPGKTYILASRLSGKDGWHVVPSNFTPVEVPSGAAAEAVVAEWKRAVAAPESQDSVFPSDVDRAANPVSLYQSAQID
ncbi:hypothetical protein ACIBO1_28590 [Micromonospora sp. NPDC049903]|uniref:hypothetical protein n=1 Tax=Micromonospora sp. NPDC049903 TaxID=3364276 RepID=UPI00379ECB6D